jgi:peptidoglycan biosynthesis protein MviN/MurJ (putative lipid II flippase)
MRRRLQGLEGKRIWKGVAQAVLATALMGAAIWLWNILFAERSVTLSLFGALVLGMGIYLLIMHIMKVPELQSLYYILREKLKNKQKGKTP